MSDEREKVGLEAILFAVYVALTPAYQILNITGSGTINKYIGYAVIVLTLIKLRLYRQPFQYERVRPIFPMLAWFAVSLLWSIDTKSTANSLVQLLSYALLWFFCSERIWNKKEKQLIVFLSILAGLYYSYVLISSQLLDIRRSTLILEQTGKSADQNGLAVALAYVFLFSADRFFRTDRALARLGYLACCLVYLVAVFSTGSRGGFISLVAGLTWFLLSYKGNFGKTKTGAKVLIISAIALLVYFIVSQDFIINDKTIIRFTDRSLLLDSNGSGRTLIWEQYLEIMNKYVYPYLVGFGYSTTFNAFELVRGYAAPGTHNTYLYLLVCSGIVGLAAFLSFVRGHFRYAKNNTDVLSCACIVVALAAMFSLDMFTNKGFWNTLIFANISLGAAPSRTLSSLKTEAEL